MSFESTYQLVAPIADSAEALSYKAVMKLTGEEVWIHIIRADAHELFEMAQKQHAASSFGEKPILEVVREGAKVYVVTRPLPPGASLGDWLKSLGQAKTPDPMQKAGAFKFDGLAAPPPPPPIPSARIDDATMQMPAFQAPVAAAPVFAPPPPPVPVVAPPPVAPPPVTPSVQEPGEFTRMFKAPSAPPPVSAPPPPAQGPGEFTQMFIASQQKPAASTSQMPSYVPPPPAAAPFDSLFPAAPQAPPAVNPDADEFNRMFQSPLMQHTPAPVNPITNPIAPPASQQAGEFTRMFKSVEPSSVLPTNAPPPPPPPAANAPGDFTRLLQTPSFGGSTAAPQAPQPFGAPQAPPPPPPSSSGGGANPFANIVDGPSFGKPSLSGPTFHAPSVGMSGMSGPSISSSGQISGPSMGTPTFNEGQMHGPSVSGQGFSGPSIRPQSLGGDQFSLDNLPGFGSGSAPSASPGVAPPTAGPLSSSGGAMNPNALSSPDGATAFFKAPPPPPQQLGAPPPAAGGAGDFTRMMQAPPVASAPAVGVPVPQSNAPAAGPAPLFSQPAAPANSSAAPAAAPQAAPAPAAKPGFLKGLSPWMIVGNVVIIVMVVLLIYVIVKSSR